MALKDVIRCQMRKKERSTDEEELATPDWRVRTGPRNKPTQREREEHEATHVPFETGAHTA